jgi:hypothetical protein
LLVLRHQLEVLGRHVKHPKLRASDRALLAAAAARLLPPARRQGLLVTPISGSPASSTSSVCRSRRARFAGCSYAPVWARCRGARDLLGREFPRVQTASVVACDFFTVETALLRR